MSKNLLKNLIDSVSLREGQSYRGDCPVCKRTNTFTITRQTTGLVWNCFSAGCNCAGFTGRELSKDDVIKSFSGTHEESVKYNRPDYFVHVTRSDVACEFLNRFQVLQTILQLKLPVFYCVKSNRVFFEDTGYGAIGRALGREYPKWLITGYPRYVHINTGSKLLFVVEDAVSAVKMACCGDAVALDGTNLTAEVVLLARNYPKVVVCLDPDATGKAIDMHAELANHVVCGVKYLRDDPKYLSVEELQTCLL